MYSELVGVLWVEHSWWYWKLLLCKEEWANKWHLFSSNNYGFYKICELQPFSSKPGQILILSIAKTKTKTKECLQSNVYDIKLLVTYHTHVCNLLEFRHFNKLSAFDQRKHRLFKSLKTIINFLLIRLLNLLVSSYICLDNELVLYKNIACRYYFNYFKIYNNHSLLI